MDTDDVIRDLAKAQGAENLDDKQVHEIKNELSNVYMDDVLDGKLDIPSEGVDHGKA